MVSAASAASRFAAREPGFGTSRDPAKPSRAGSRVRATATATSTVPAAPIPMTARNGMPTIDRPHSAMITVRPAKTTAEPAVPVARAVDSSGSIPAASWVRWRDRMNSA